MHTSTIQFLVGLTSLSACLGIGFTTFGATDDLFIVPYFFCGVFLVLGLLANKAPLLPSRINLLVFIYAVHHHPYKQNELQHN